MMHACASCRKQLRLLSSSNPRVVSSQAVDGNANTVRVPYGGGFTAVAVVFSIPRNEMTIEGTSNEARVHDNGIQ